MVNLIQISAQWPGEFDIWHFKNVAFHASEACIWHMLAACTILAATVKLIATKLQPSNACARFPDFTQHCHASQSVVP